MFTIQAMNDCLIEVLEEVYISRCDLFPKIVASVEELSLVYQVYQSQRRISGTVALEEEVDSDDINIVNRWTELEKSKG